MEYGKESYRILLSHATEMGGMMYWRFFCDQNKLEISDQVFSCLGINGVDDFDEDRKLKCFERYIESIAVEKREIFKDIISGYPVEESGTLFYQVLWNGEIGYHKCMYSKTKEGDENIVIGVIQDMTLLKRQEERNTKIIEAIPDFIFIFDKNFFIRDVLKSPDIELLHSVEYLIGVDGRDVYSAEASQLFIDSIDSCLAGKGLQEIEYPLDSEDGQRYYFQARMVPFDGDKVMALIHDSSDRAKYTEELIRARKEAEQADKMKSTFLANMSHEIRTPLNAIVGFSELLLSADMEERETYMDIIRKNSELLLQLIDDILDLSRLESGKTEIHCQQIDMNLLMSEIAQIHSVKMKPGVRLFTKIPEDNILLYTDRNRVTQVVFNFMSNAIKNTVAGSITLQMSEENGWIRISVEDTGCGIPEEQVSSIFERFTKINDFVQGTGLGLTICNTIAEKLGGKIEVSSVYGKGSTFTIVLPVIAEKEVEERGIVSGKEYVASTSGGNRKTILVAEDVEANFILLNAILQKHYSIVWAMNGREAVKIFRDKAPDLILMDIKMPLMDGIEAARIIRTYSNSVPIIAVTAHAFSTEKQTALDAGCNDVVLKPYNQQALKETIIKHLS